jgi:hypothetical protein
MRGTKYVLFLLFSNSLPANKKFYEDLRKNNSLYIFTLNRDVNRNYVSLYIETFNLFKILELPVT